MADPTEVILGSVVVITTTSIIRNVNDKDAKRKASKTIVFGFMLAVALLAIAIGAPRGAILLAYLGLVGAFVVNGPTLFKLVGDLGR